MDELDALERLAAARGITQKILLRLTPGIDPHTHQKINTGTVDSKFGVAIETGQALEAARLALSKPHLELHGFHCHVGPKLFTTEPFLDAVQTMLGFIASVRDELGFTADILNLGGGFGVRYIEEQPTANIAKNIAEIADFVKKTCENLQISMPEIGFEPGRSIVADAGMTLYTVGSCKTIPGYLTYLSVDGGMTDNVRHAMYGAPYTILPADKMDEPREMAVTVAGRCCESGDILQKDVPMPRSMARGDLLACLTTGAYHYSMASNYNRIPRPPVVMLCGGESYVAVRRESFEDLLKLDE
jgi:diaminopimelate decarboxylase